MKMRPGKCPNREGDQELAAHLLADTERLRQETGRRLESTTRASLGQFFTPLATAQLMASMSVSHREHVRLLDPGAGVGSLTAAWVAEMCCRADPPRELVLTAFEIDASLVPPLRRTLAACEKLCHHAGVSCRWEAVNGDFIKKAVEALDGGLFGERCPEYDVAILNPPYKKFRTDSTPRLLLARLGFETSNLYTAFVSLVVRLLSPGGEMISITPRSFCNGPYFRPFRQHLLSSVSLNRVHVFESRDQAFREDDVLQENVIMQALKGVPQRDAVVVSQSRTPDDPECSSRPVPFCRVVRPDDPECFIHLVPNEEGHALELAMEKLPCTLERLGLTVSTGRVVDFRAREWLRPDPGPRTVPLIYPTHFERGFVTWPKPGSRKPNAIVLDAASADLMVPSGVYVLVKRFSSKEEPRRVVAALFDPDRAPCKVVGFENHLNYFHERGEPLDRTLALGLAGFLNSSPLDTYFRQFNGHTQVNATDLRTLRYPSRSALIGLGKRLADSMPEQAVLDRIVEEVLGAPVGNVNAESA